MREEALNLLLTPNQPNGEKDLQGKLYVELDREPLRKFFFMAYGEKFFDDIITKMPERIVLIMPIFINSIINGILDRITVLKSNNDHFSIQLLGDLTKNLTTLFKCVINEHRKKLENEFGRKCLTPYFNNNGRGNN